MSNESIPKQRIGLTTRQKLLVGAALVPTAAAFNHLLTGPNHTPVDKQPLNTDRTAISHAPSSRAGEIKPGQTRVKLPHKNPEATLNIEKARKLFQSAAKKAGKEVLQDIANPASHSETYSTPGYGYGSMGNKGPLIQMGGDAIDRIANMFVHFNQTEGKYSFYINSITGHEVGKTKSGETDYKFTTLSLQYKVGKQTADELLAKKKSGATLTATDYASVIDNNDVTATSVLVSNDERVTGDETLAMSTGGIMTYDSDQFDLINPITLTESDALPVVDRIARQLASAESHNRGTLQ